MFSRLFKQRINYIVVIEYFEAFLDMIGVLDTQI